MSDWIDVRKKRPEKYERVLVTDGKNICLHYQQSDFSFGEPYGQNLHCSCIDNHKYCEIDPDKITYWMLLPKLPDDA